MVSWLLGFGRPLCTVLNALHGFLMRLELWKRLALGLVILSVMLRLLGLLFLPVPWDLLRALGKQTSRQILVSNLPSKAS